MGFYLLTGFVLSSGKPAEIIGQVWAAGAQKNNMERITMWTKPQFEEIRFGFEITMYIANR